MIAAPYALSASSLPIGLQGALQPSDPAQLDALAALWEGLEALAAAAALGPPGAVSRLCRALTPASTVSQGAARLRAMAASALLAYRRLGGHVRLEGLDMAETVTDIAFMEQSDLLALVRSGAHGAAAELASLAETVT